MPIDSFLSLAQVAKKLDMKEDTVAGWVRDGRMPGIKIGRSWHVPETGFNEWMKNGGTTAHPAGTFAVKQYSEYDEREGDKERGLVDGESNSEPVPSASPEKARKGNGKGGKRPDPRARENGKSGKDGKEPEPEPAVPDFGLPIVTFSAHETGKLVERIQTRFPLEWMPRWKKLLTGVPQFEGFFSNMIRCWCFWGMVIMEARLENGETFDPVWEMRKTTDILKERQRLEDEMVEGVRKTVAKILKNPSRKVRKQELAMIEEQFEILPEHLKVRLVRVINDARDTLGMKPIVLRKKKVTEEGDQEQDGFTGNGRNRELDAARSGEDGPE